MAAGNLYPSSAGGSWPSEFASQGHLGVMIASDGELYGGVAGTDYSQGALTASGQTVTIPNYGSQTAMTIPAGEGVNSIRCAIFGSKYYSGYIRVKLSGLPTDVAGGGNFTLSGDIYTDSTSSGHHYGYTSIWSMPRALTATELAAVVWRIDPVSGNPGVGDESAYAPTGQCNLFFPVTTGPLSAAGMAMLL